MQNPFLGVELVKRLKKLTGCRTYMGPGANPRTAVPLHKHALQHQVGKLNHYYMLGHPDEFRVAQIRQAATSAKNLGVITGRYSLFTTWNSSIADLISTPGVTANPTRMTGTSNDVISNTRSTAMTVTP